METQVTSPPSRTPADPAGCGSSCGAGCGSAPVSASASGPVVETLIDRFLSEQASMTAAERFSRHHDRTAPDAQPALAPTYVDLMPATPPGPGQQYAFAVDLDACTGCKACVTACHSLNGLDEGETWRSVGLLVGDEGQQHITAACHHCVEPGCLNGCPVDAYEKDPITGIVRHHDDQCIGCSYCTLTCPYEVPTYDRDRGIVRKCDLCADRLGAGEAPACVQGCPTHAISVEIVDVDVVAAAASAPWPIAAPAPDRTIPTTSYRSARDLSAATAADLHEVRVNHGHPPLAVMLVLTQVAVGTFLVDLALRLLGVLPERAGATSAVLGLGVAVVALGASTLHLGRPRYAYRAVIGLRHSWLSREIVAFGVFAGLATLHAGVLLLGVHHPLGGHVLPAAVALSGILGIACSVLIYAVTGRRWWRVRALAARFGLTTLLGGLVVVLLVCSVTAAGAPDGVARTLALLLVVATIVKLGTEAAILRHRNGPAGDELARTARLLLGPLAVITRWRVVLALLGGIVAPLVWVAVVRSVPEVAGPPVLIAFLGAGALISGEVVERLQMFTASSPNRMPGGVR
jgi:formate dehydrogenase iron-sulfur subunit